MAAYLKRKTCCRRLLVFAAFSIFSMSFPVSAAQDAACRQPKKLRLVFENAEYVSLLVYSKETSIDSLKKVAVILPPAGGANFIDSGYGKYFCKNGIDSVVVRDWSGANREYSPLDLTSHQKELEFAKAAVTRIVNYFSESKIAFLATSKGGIGLTAFANALSDNVKLIISIVAGGPLHLVISRSNGEGLDKLRSARLSYFGITQDEYDELIKNNLQFRTEQPRKSIKIGMVFASDDETVPTDLQKNLFTLWKPDWSWVVQRGHIGTVAVTYRMLSDDFVKLLKQNLK